MNKLNQIFTVLKLIVTIIVVGLSVLLMLTVLPIRGNVKVLTVLSGSMEPAIKTGSVVVIGASESYVNNDVVTFNRPGTKELVTHRISAVKYEGSDKVIYTKGDNNEELDAWTIRDDNIVGKVFLTIPWLGYVQQWLRTPVGFVVAVVLPASIIIYGELLNIKSEIWKFIMKRKSSSLLAIGLFALATLPFNYTKAYLFDKESSSGNVIGVATSYEPEVLPLNTALELNPEIINDDPDPKLIEPSPTPEIASPNLNEQVTIDPFENIEVVISPTPTQVIEIPTEPEEQI